MAHCSDHLSTIQDGRQGSRVSSAMAWVAKLFSWILCSSKAVGRGTRLPGTSHFLASLIVNRSLLRCAGTMPDKIGRYYTGVDLRQPLMSLIASFRTISIFGECTLWLQTGAAYSAVEYARATEDVCRVSKDAPHPVLINENRYRGVMQFTRDLHSVH